MTTFADAVERKDLDALRDTLHPDVRFSSPAVFKPYLGRDTVLHVLTAVMTVFQDFRYVDRFTSDAGDAGQVLRFAATVGDRAVEGVDILSVDADGLVTELTVLIRPLSGLTAVVAGMAEALGGSRP